jgi:hypothetical protein
MTFPHFGGPSWWTSPSQTVHTGLTVGAPPGPAVAHRYGMPADERLELDIERAEQAPFTARQPAARPG